VAKLGITNEGRTVGVWADSVTHCSASVQANRTSASMMIYPNTHGGAGLNHPFVIGVSHSVDKGESRGYIQVPALSGDEETRYFTFQEFVAAMDAAKSVERLTERVAELEAALAAKA
jgi:hypothetical protein